MIARSAVALSGITPPPGKVTPVSAIVVLLALLAGLLSPHHPAPLVDSLRVPAGVPATAECLAQVQALYRHRDYVAAMAPCLGPEDSPAVDSILSTRPV